MGRGLRVAALLLCFCVHSSWASEGDRGVAFSSCIAECASTGCVRNSCIPGCTGGASGLGLVAEPPVLKITQWSCSDECRYQCMRAEEEKRSSQNLEPLKYYGKWPFIRVLGMQEPASVLFSVLNLIVTLLGILRFSHLVFRKLPRKSSGSRLPVYDYAGLWLAYGALALHAWLWSAVFHARDTPFTQAWDYSSAIALIGGVLILALIRTLNLRLEAPRVMYSAPIIAFTATHILYLNFYNFDYGLNMKVCLTMGVAQLLVWVGWALLTQHPSRVKLCVAVLGTSLAMLFEVFDFPPMKGVVDAHSLWHLATIPLTHLWWSFICDDAVIYTQKAKKGWAKKTE